MSSLKELKNRIGSVKNTQKITKAMKMVAAAKLRRAQEAAEASRPYSEKMEEVVTSLASSTSSESVLLNGTGNDEKHLIVIMTADRGLCGGFNSSLVRAVRRKLQELAGQGKKGYLLCVGSKGYDQLRGEFKSQILGRINDITKKRIAYGHAQRVSDEILTLFREHKLDNVTIVFNKFKSAISQEVTFQQLIPLTAPTDAAGESYSSDAVYEYEPSADVILEDLLPRNITVQCFKALLENAASEQGARMTAMDNATRNAGDMINKLSLVYNRTRQAAITTELTEIISGAEAV
jgi:F-type H+-transporting ATPase subunit gamma